MNIIKYNKNYDKPCKYLYRFMPDIIPILTTMLGSRSIIIFILQTRESRSREVS